MRKAGLPIIVQCFLAASLSLTVAVNVCGCKDTDFFTEVLISSSAQEVDEDNPERVVVNSPEGEEESDSLSSLKWTNKSQRQEQTENLVVWGEEPNSNLVTHHSIYDLAPQFPGIAASDGVRLVFNSESDLDHTVDEGSGESRDDMESVSPSDTGKESQNSSASSVASEESLVKGGSDSEDVKDESSSGSADSSSNEGGSSSDKGAGDAEEGEESGGESSGGDSGTGQSTDPSDDPGETIDKYAGYGGSLTVYDPHNAKQDIPQADSIAVIGKRAAVMVQAIGGEGSICAMSKEAYKDTEANTAASFEDIFGDECDSSVVVWDSDDASIKDVSPSKLAKACEGKTLILYDQDLCTGDSDPNSTFFTQDQLKELYAAGVVGFAPLSFDSEYGLVDAAYYIGQALSNSKNLKEGWSSEGMADSYASSIDNIVKAVIGANSGKGTWVYGNEASNSKSTEYRGSAVKSSGASTYVHGLIAVDAQTGLSYSGDSRKVDATDIVLFGGYGQNTFSPLGFWMQAAGVADTLVDKNTLNASDESTIGSDFRTLLWGTSSAGSVSKKNLSGTGGAYSLWNGSTSSMTISGVGTGGDSAGKEFGGGLGSKNMPYLVVCGSSDGKLSGKEVKKAVVSDIKSSSSYTPYSAFSYSNKTREAIAPYNSGVVSTIGDTNFRQSQNPFKNGLSASDAVRVNPTGLLGNWTKGNFECVLESVWLASIYTESPSGCAYEPNYDWSNFSAEIGEDTVKGSDYGGDAKAIAKEVITDFYSTFYRYDVDYSDVVSDQGL